jgi:ferredoxin
MRIAVDREICASSGMCVLTAADVFDQDEEDGRVILLRAVPRPGQEKAVYEAVLLCPSSALRFDEGAEPAELAEDDSGGPEAAAAR